ncbi:hypothetical protein T265_14213, partial [Opisthorchis viverrini]
LRQPTSLDDLSSAYFPSPYPYTFSQFPPISFQTNLSALITLSLRAAAMSTLNSQRRSNQPTWIGDNRVGEMIASCQLNAAEPTGHTRDRTDILFRHCRRDGARVTVTTASRHRQGEISLTPVGVLRTRWMVRTGPFLKPDFGREETASIISSQTVRC